MSEHREPIPSMLYNAAVGGHVTNSQQIIDENENKEQSQINAEVKQTLGQGGSVDTRINQAKNDIIGGASSNGNTLKKVEDRVSPLESAIGSGGNVDARIANAVNTEKTRAQGAENALDGRVDTLEEAVGTGGSVDSRIASAVATETSRAQTAEADRYTKSETYTKEEVHNLITTPSQEYVSVSATAQTTSVTDVLPATGAANTTYRVGNWDGTQYNDSVFSEYAWNGSAYIKLSTKLQVGEVYDISANHADTKYADLTAALGTNGANIPQSLRKGGMSVKFVQSSDNKYVQYRLMSDSFTTNVYDWQIENIQELSHRIGDPLISDNLSLNAWASKQYNQGLKAGKYIITSSASNIRVLGNDTSTLITLSANVPQVLEIQNYQASFYVQNGTASAVSCSIEIKVYENLDDLTQKNKEDVYQTQTNIGCLEISAKTPITGNSIYVDFNGSNRLPIKGKYKIVVKEIDNTNGWVLTETTSGGTTFYIGLSEDGYITPRENVDYIQIYHKGGFGIGEIDFVVIYGESYQVIDNKEKIDEILNNEYSSINALRQVNNKTLSLGTSFIPSTSGATHNANWSIGQDGEISHISASDWTEFVFADNLPTGTKYYAEIETPEVYGQFGMAFRIGDGVPADPYNGTTEMNIGLFSDGGSLKILGNGKIFTISKITLSPILASDDPGVVRTVQKEVYNVKANNSPDDVLGYWNTVVGPEDCFAHNINGTRNIAIGRMALNALEGGLQNVAIGTFALAYFKNGQGNIGIGADTFYMSKGGNHNIAIGRSALEGHNTTQPINYNIAIGYNALTNCNNTTTRTVAVGGQANKDGSPESVFIGDEAGLFSPRGNGKNVVIGRSANAKTDGNQAVEDSIAIGYGVIATKSHQCVIGNSSLEELVIGNKKIIFHQDGSVTWETVS